MRRKVVLTGAALIGLLLLAGCSDLTTTGYPAGEDGSAEKPTRAADPLSGTSWRLASGEFDGRDLATFKISAAFAEGSMSGQAPVNSYSAGYEVDGEHLSFSQIASTKKAGPAEDMRAEGAYFAALAAVTSYSMESGQLQLFGGGETELLAFVPAEDPSAEPTDPAEDQIAQTQAFADTLVGQSEEDAMKATDDAEYSFRVIERDGEPLPATSDYRTDRVNVAITDGTVTRATAG